MVKDVLSPGVFLRYVTLRPLIHRTFLNKLMELWYVIKSICFNRYLHVKEHLNESLSIRNPQEEKRDKPPSVRRSMPSCKFAIGSLKLGVSHQDSSTQSKGNKRKRQRERGETYQRSVRGECQLNPSR